MQCDDMRNKIAWKEYFCFYHCVVKYNRIYHTISEYLQDDFGLVHFLAVSFRVHCNMVILETFHCVVNFKTNLEIASVMPRITN